MTTSEEHLRIRVAELVPNGYDDFLTYCSIAGRVFTDEITPVDYVAYRSQFGREKSEVKQLRAIIEAGVSLRDSDAQAEAVDAPAEVPDAPATDTNEGEPTLLGVEAAIHAPQPDKPGKNENVHFSLSNGAEDSKRSYADILGLDANDFAEILLEKDLREFFSVSLSVRSLNALKNSGRDTLSKLLLLTPEKLGQIKNLGAKSIREIETALVEIARKGPVSRKILRAGDHAKPNPTVRTKVLKPIIEAKLSDEQYSLEDLSDNEKAYFARSVEAASVLGPDVSLDLIHGNHGESVKDIICTLTTFYQKHTFDQTVIASAEDAAAHWNPELSSKWLLPFLRLYCALQRKPLSQEFKAFMVRDITVGQYVELVRAQLKALDHAVDSLANELASFQSWIDKSDLAGLCKRIFERNSSKSGRVFDVLSARSAGQTLEEIGQQYGLTRERVRQLEKKALEMIQDRLSNSSYDLFGLISAYRNGDHILREDEILETLGEKYGRLVWYCAIRTTNNGKAHLLDTEISNYDNGLNAIVVFGAERLSDSATDDFRKTAEEFICGLPDLIETTALTEELSAYSREKGLSEELFVLAAAKQYRKAGIYSYKGRLTVIQMCECVLKTRFPNGYKISDEIDGKRFANYLLEFFGEHGRMTPRAIDATVMRFGVLIDRGKYVHTDYVHVGKSMMDKVFAYVEASPKSALTYSEIFAALEDLFQGTAITNRYALQGAMKLYDCPYPSHRDYISKDANVNVADELNAFVEAAGTVHKSEIFEEFPGWKEYNLGFILPRCPEVIRLDGGSFMHASRLDITEEDRYRIKKYLDSNLHEIPISARYLQNEFMNLFPEFMIKNDVQTHGKLYGILQYMFPKDYHFSRPYLAKEDSGAITKKSVLLKHLEAMDTIDVDDLVDLCKQNAVNYASVSTLLDMMQPEFIRVDAATLLRRENVGLAEEMLADISDLITGSIATHNGYLAAGSVEDFSWYPTLHVPWTPFLLESVANLIPDGINTVKMVSSSSDVPHAIFVSDDYADDDWNSLLVKLLKEKHETEPFLCKADVLKWLQAEGLCNVTYPAFLDTENHVYFDETGKLRVE